MDRLQTVSGHFVAPKENFRYTTSAGCLTLEQRRFYEEYGYLVVPSLYSKEDMKSWQERFLEYCDGKQRPMGMQLVRDISLVKAKKNIKGQAGVTKIQDWQEDDVLFTYCTKQELLPYLKSFCGEDVKSVHTMLINKPPGMGKTSRHPLHQDLAYFPFRSEDQIVAAWTAMEDIDRENGGLIIYPGSHKGEFLKHGYPDWDKEGGVNKAYFGIKELPKDLKHGPMHVNMKAGDCLLFHPLLIHGSGENKTAGYRKAMCCHFASAHCKYIEVKGTIHEDLADDIMGYAKKKFFNDASGFQYTDIWRFKSKLVIGNEDPEGL